jgi:hypothetical protein
MLTRFTRLVGLVSLPIWTATPLLAQAELGLRASTLGIGVEVGYRLAPRIGLRVGGNLLSFTRDEQVEGIDYKLTPDLQSFSGVADLYPFGGGFHLTGGVVLNRNTARAVAVIGPTIELGGRTYTNTQIQSLRGDLDWSKSLAPYLGLGLASGGRVGIAFEAGVVFSGTPAVGLSAVTSLTGPEKAQFDQAVLDEETEIRNWIDEHERFTKYYPVVALGIRVRF